MASYFFMPRFAYRGIFGNFLDEVNGNLEGERLKGSLATGFLRNNAYRDTLSYANLGLMHESELAHLVWLFCRQFL